MAPCVGVVTTSTSCATGSGDHSCAATCALWRPRSLVSGTGGDTSSNVGGRAEVDCDGLGLDFALGSPACGVSPFLFLLLLLLEELRPDLELCRPRGFVTETHSSDVDEVESFRASEVLDECSVPSDEGMYDKLKVRSCSQFTVGFVAS